MWYVLTVKQVHSVPKITPWSSFEITALANLKNCTRKYLKGKFIIIVSTQIKTAPGKKLKRKVYCYFNNTNWLPPRNMYGHVQLVNYCESYYPVTSIRAI